jgi:hypothetical protein
MAKSTRSVRYLKSPLERFEFTLTSELKHILIQLMSTQPTEGEGAFTGDGLAAWTEELLWRVPEVQRCAEEESLVRQARPKRGGKPQEFPA